MAYLLTYSGRTDADLDFYIDGTSVRVASTDPAKTVEASHIKLEFQDDPRTVTVNGQVVYDEFGWGEYEFTLVADTTISLGFDSVIEYTAAPSPYYFKHYSTGGGGTPINGEIKEFVVDENSTINPGDFVQFNYKYGTGYFSQGSKYKDVKSLSDGRALVAYIEGSDLSILKMRIISYGNGNIVLGQELTANLASGIYGSSAHHPVEICVLSDNSAIVAVCQRNGCLRLFLISFAELSISIENIAEPSVAYSDSFASCSMSKIDASHAIVVCSYKGIVYNEYGYAKSFVVSISDNVFSISTIKLVTYAAGTDRQGTFGKNYYVGNVFVYSLFEVDPKNFLVCISERHYVGDSSESHTDNIFKLAVSQSYDVTVSTVASYSTAKVYSLIRATKLSSDKIAVHHFDSSGNKYIDVYRYTGSLTLESQNAITTSSNSYFEALSQSKILWFSGVSYSIVNVSDSFSMTMLLPLDLPSSDSSMIMVSPNSILFVGGANTEQSRFSSLTVSGNTVSVDTVTGMLGGVLAQKASTDRFNLGVAKTGGSTGDTIEVYCVPAQSNEQ